MYDARDIEQINKHLAAMGEAAATIGEIPATWGDEGPLGAAKAIKEARKATPTPRAPPARPPGPAGLGASCRPMDTVTLVRRRSGFDNVPDSFAVYVPGAWYDEYTEDLTAYALPPGYRVGKDQLDELQVWDQRDQCCEIVQHACGRPQLVSIGKGGVDPQMPVLTRAS